jgi:aminoglycoside phosphotransferase (APT) family kinase protein
VSPPNPWEPDVETDAARCTARIQTRFPDLAPARLEALGVGWDNAAYLVNGALVFRFPRRRLAVELLQNELRALPHVAPCLPVPVPAPSHVGTPDEANPYPFAGYPLLPGTTACRVAWTDEGRTALAVPLARFLRALHDAPCDASVRAWAAVDDWRSDLERRARANVERLVRRSPPLEAGEVARAVAASQRLSRTPPWAAPTRWVHGDLYARHLLVDEDRRLVGVIDWGDVHLGDPALDLSIAWSFLPARARPAFLEAYGPVDEATWDRARFRALHYGALLVDYGVKVGDDALLTVGRYALGAAAT